MSPRTSIGVDLGGTKLLAVVLVDDDVVAESRRPTGRAIGVAGVADRLEDALEDLARSSGLQLDDCPIAIGFPGLVDAATGRVRSSVILDDWEGVDAVAALSSRGRRVVGVANDVQRAALAEVWTRGRRGDVVRDLLCLTVGTGIGGALVIDGRVWTGSSGVAGEVGHMYAGGSARCDCGASGCAHLFASARAIEAELGIAPGSLGSRLRSGDTRARQAVSAGAERLGLVLASAVHLLDVPVVAIGGGLGSWPEFVPEVAASFARSAMPEVAARCTVEAMLAGPRAGAIGAALAARDRPAP